MTGATGAPARAATVDIAKGIAISAVVFAHVTLGLRSAGLISDRFINWSAPAYLWYMCIFFFASGLFVAKSLRRDGTGRFIWKKVLELGYPFLVWSLIFGATQLAFAQYTNSGPGSAEGVLIGLLPWAPREHMWFLPALFIAFTVTAFCHRLGGAHWRWLLLVVATLMLAAAPLAPGWNQRLQYTFWMAIGALVAASAAMRWMTDTPRARLSDWGIGVAATAAFVVVVVTVVGPRRSYYEEPLTLVLATSIGILAVVCLSRLLTLAGPLGVALARIGEWSLYIYLTHVPLLAAIRVAMTRGLDVSSAVVITAVSSAACIAAGCLAGRLDRAGGLPWVFRLPDSVIARTTGTRPQRLAREADPLADR